MKKVTRHITILTIALAVSAGFTSVALAASVNGPTGTLIDGWYKDSVSGSVNTDPLAKCGIVVSGSNDLVFEEGVHTYSVIEYSDNGLSQEIDGQVVSTIDSASCETDSVTIWSEVVKLDKTPPALSVTAPADNTNTTASEIAVSGTVSDSGSGVASVTVNGKAATVSGNDFSVTAPLVVGLNSISVVATDNVGHVTDGPRITVLRSASTGSAQGVKPTLTSSSPSPSRSPDQPAVLGDGAISNVSTNDASPQPTTTVTPRSKPVSALVKGVAYGGISLATLLVVALILALLARLGVISLNIPGVKRPESRL